MSVPTANDPAGTLIFALPLFRVVAVEVYVPLVSVTAPVGVGLAVPSLTPTVTASTCAVVMLVDDNVIVTVGVAVGEAVSPVALETLDVKVVSPG